MLYPSDFQHPVVFLHRQGFGDTILSLPALRALAQLFPERLTLVCCEDDHRLCYRELPASGLVLIETRLVEGGPKYLAFDASEAVSIANKVNRCDLFLSLIPGFSLSGLEFLMNHLTPRVSVGFFPYFDVRLPRDFSKHSTELSFDVPRLFDGSLHLENFAAPPRFVPEAQTKAQQLCSMLPSWARIIAVHADTSPEKMWISERFVTVLDRFLEQHDDFFALIVGWDRVELDGGRYGSRVIPCYGLPLDVSMCMVAQADLFLGIDSCMLHVADFNSVPGVGLFGPTSSDEWGFRFGLHRHVCAESKMDAIEVDAVLDALEAVFSESRRVEATAGPRRSNRGNELLLTENGNQ